MFGSDTCYYMEQVAIDYFCGVRESQDCAIQETHSIKTHPSKIHILSKKRMNPLAIWFQTYYVFFCAHKNRTKQFRDLLQ